MKYIIVSIVLSLIVGISIGRFIYEGKDFSYLNENMQDCISKGGRYYLSVGDKGDFNVDYETCSIEEIIRY